MVISIKSVSLSTAYTDTILTHHWAHLTWPFVRQWFWPLMVLNFEHILMIIFVHPFPSCEDIGICIQDLIPDNEDVLVECMP